jgi:hypothetical protein
MDAIYQKICDARAPHTHTHTHTHTQHTQTNTTHNTQQHNTYIYTPGTETNKTMRLRASSCEGSHRGWKRLVNSLPCSRGMSDVFKAQGQDSATCTCESGSQSVEATPKNRPIISVDSTDSISIAQIQSFPSRVKGSW